MKDYPVLAGLNSEERTIVQTQPIGKIKRLIEVETKFSTKQEGRMSKFVRENKEDKIADEAIHWFVRLRAENKTELEHDHFFDWLFESPKHQTAFSEILKLWDTLEIVKGGKDSTQSTLNLLNQASCRVELSALS